MPKSFLLPFDLFYNVADHIPTRADISALGRCSRNFREMTLPRLYRDIEFSIYKVGSLATALRSNDHLSKYCRRLSVTCNGTPNRHQKRPLRSKCTSQDLTEQEKRVLSETTHDINYVMTSCLEQGNLTHLSWAVSRYNLRNTSKFWKNISSSRLSLRSLTIDTTINEDVHAALEAISGYSFPELSTIKLKGWLHENYYKVFWRFVSCLPALSMLDLSLTVEESEQGQIFGNTFIPEIKLERLASLTIMVGNNVWDRRYKTYPLPFLRNQPALVELTALATDIFHPSQLVASPTLKALNIQEDSQYLPSPRFGNAFLMLTTLRIQIGIGVKQEWKDFVNELSSLQCIEVFQTMFVDHHGHAVKDCFAYDALDGIRKDLVEYHAVHQFRVLHGIDLKSSKFAYSQEAVASTERIASLFICTNIATNFLPQDILLASCVNMKTIRAICVTYKYDAHDNSKDVNVQLPEEHVLIGVKIPDALEYVRWEVPWEARLYKVTKTDDSVKLVYMNCDRLPGRRYYPSLTWTNDSLFDHVKC